MAAPTEANWNMVRSTLPPLAWLNRFETFMNWLSRYGGNLAGPPDRHSDAVDVDSPQRRLFQGFVKLRLGHARGRSFLVPDVIIAAGGTRFFVPSFFGPPVIGFNEEPGQHKLMFNLDVGAPRDHELCRLMLEVRSRDRVRAFDDGAQWYRCTINGPRQITRYAAGTCVPLDCGDFALRVFHHTTPQSAGKILRSGELWSSPWNLAGTRKLLNVSYGYFTTLPRITNERDLHRIAMASDGEIAFQTTSDRVIEDVLRLKVYRGSTVDRTVALPFNVPSGVVSPAHLRFHPMIGSTMAYYEVGGPEIVRVGMTPPMSLAVVNGDVRVRPEDIKRFDYVVIGDASTKAGLAAPYEEEDTNQVVHLERLGGGLDLFEFWQANQNTDLVTGRKFERRVVQSPEGGECGRAG